MNSRVLIVAAFAAGFALLIVTMPKPRPGRDQTLAATPTVRRTARTARPRARGTAAARPSHLPWGPKGTPLATTTASAKQTLISEALDETAPSGERTQALDALDPNEIDPADVAKLAYLATAREIDKDVRAAAMALLLAIAQEGNRAARLCVLAFFVTEPPDDTAEPEIGSLLADQDPEVRRAAAGALGSAAPESRGAASQALERAFSTEQEPEVQETIALAILRVLHDGARPALERMARSNTTPSAAQIVTRLLEEMARAEATASATPTLAPPDMETPEPSSGD